MSAQPKNISRTGDRRPSSRLQRRAPASLQISPVSAWNVAIPLLSPLATSPTSTDRPSERDEPRKDHHQNPSSEAEKPVFKRWQHPAAPFCYEPATLLPPFVPV